MSTRFLPPYSVYRFALWSFLLGLGTRWGQAGEAVQVDFSVWLAGQSVGQLAVDMATDTCLLGPARLCCHLPGLRPLLQWPAGVRTQTGQRGCLKSRRAKEQAPPGGPSRCPCHQEHVWPLSGAPETAVQPAWETIAPSMKQCPGHTHWPSSPYPQVHALQGRVLLCVSAEGSGDLPLIYRVLHLEQSLGALVFCRDVPKCRCIQFPVLSHRPCYLLSRPLCLNRWVKLLGHLARGCVCVAGRVAVPLKD